LTLFEKETAGVMSLLHRNIASTVDRGKSNNQYFIVQEFFGSGSLREQMRAGAMEPARAVKIAIAICEALDYSHRRGLPHRHLVPENVFLVGGDVVKVGDFGMTLLSSPPPTDGSEVATDLFDLGALLYEMIGGSSPGVRPTPLSGRAGVTPKLDELLSRSL